MSTDAVAQAALRAAPILETARLVLRPHRPGDLEAAFAMWGDPRTVEYILGKPSTRDETWSRILRFAGLWALLGFGYWAIEEKTSGRFVGDAGLADFKRPIEPPLDGIPESGWTLDQAFHGNGYATEAVGAVLAWADRHLDAPITACMVAPENRASLRVALKNGYSEWLRTSFKGNETILLKRERAPVLERRPGRG